MKTIKTTLEFTSGKEVVTDLPLDVNMLEKMAIIDDEGRLTGYVNYCQLRTRLNSAKEQTAFAKLRSDIVEALDESSYSIINPFTYQYRINLNGKVIKSINVKYT